MRRILWVLALAGLSACATPGGRNTTADTIRHEMDAAVQESVKPSKPDAVNNALLPPLSVSMPKVDSKPLEVKFDLTVNNTPASQVFMAIVSGTRYSMLVPPDVNGNISLNLKDVTVFEALEVIREMYGYEYKVDAARIFIQPVSLQTRIFQVNYLTGQRKGESSLRVSGGSVGDAGSSSTGGTATTTTPSSTSSSSSGARSDSSKVTMSSNTDFWTELSHSLIAIVGNEKGRSVVISPMSGIIVVRAMPDEIKNVAAYLKASQISIERQVILEAKIVEVRLNDGFQSGINWAAFKNGPNSRASIGQIAPGGTMGSGISLVGGTNQGANTLPASMLGTITPGTNMVGGAAAGSLIGLAFQTSNFATLLDFLESQGNVHVLSSPRIATLNNQKAVLKVGTDDFFVTNVSTTTTTSGVGAATSSPSVTLQPFFSGIALDVTPRIDENNEIILHVHPSVTNVQGKNTSLPGAGLNGGPGDVLLASSTISETDSIVRAHDGQIVAIGGLMSQATFDDQSGLPGLPKTLFGQTNKRTEKRELVILLRPTVVDNDRDWSDDITRSRDRMNGMTNSSGSRP